MRRRVITDGWKALPLVAVAVGGLLWHVLACMESPMSFAPNGDLAFATVEPYDDEAVAVHRTHVYRLMVLPSGAAKPKVLEESVDWMISAPGFSPDGKRVAYLRIPLLTAEDLTRVAETCERSLKVREPTTQPVEFNWPRVVTPTRVSSAPAIASDERVKDMTLPPWQMTRSYPVAMSCVPAVPAQLLERDAATGDVLSATEVSLPLVPSGESSEDGFSGGLKTAYVLTRLQYSPDGRWVYLCVGTFSPGSFVWAVNPSEQIQRLMATQAGGSALSPDGTLLAVQQIGCLVLVRTDGSAANYVRWEKPASSAGMVWAGNNALVILGTDKINDKEVHCLSFVKTDGTIAKTVALPEMKAGDEGDTGQLAMSADGTSVVVAFNRAAYFLGPSGKLLSAQEGDDKKGYLAQPTFSRDGKQVAFKVMKPRGDKVFQTAEIAFFSPAGKELRRVNVPAPKLPETQPTKSKPAKRPTTGPYEKDLGELRPEMP